MSSEKRSNWHVRASRYVPLFLWILLILFFSTGDAASVRTSLFVRPILEWLFPTADDATLALYHSYIRKLAHVFEYGVLGILASRAFSWSKSVRNYWKQVLLLVIGVAAVDEFNQSLNPQRTGSIVDVGIDLVGGILGIVAFLALSKVFSRRMTQKPID